MHTAVYAGSFDPPTNGHLWMIQRGLELFDRLIVAIGTNPEKNYSFSVTERLELLEASVPSCERLSFSHFDNRYLVDYAKEQNAAYILRGVRTADDYEYERVMRHINDGHLDPGMLDPEIFSKHLYTRYYPDPDLLIRTSGEMRISNFLLWQISYAELYITKKLWPDFNKNDLHKAVTDYANRDRRYGGI